MFNALPMWQFADFIAEKEETSVYFYVSCQPAVSRDHKGSESIFFDLNWAISTIRLAQVQVFCSGGAFGEDDTVCFLSSKWRVHDIFNCCTEPSVWHVLQYRECTRARSQSDCSIEYGRSIVSEVHPKYVRNFWSFRTLSEVRALFL